MRIKRHNQEFELSGGTGAVLLLAESVQFDTWLARMDPRFRIHHVCIQAADTRFDGGLLFAKLAADVTDEEGNRVPGAVFLRGDAVGILIILTGESRQWAVLTVQPRFPTGQYDSVEIPAGMLDDHGDFRGTAAREISEETGLEIHAEELVFLGEFFPSCGGSDEKVQLYVCERHMAEAEIDVLEGTLAGMHHEHERIRVTLVPLDELPAHTNDPKALIAYGYYYKWVMGDGFQKSEVRCP
jgi:8-oxo-dGTP pyrophosphatase MutT (NUDIX family)